MKSAVETLDPTRVRLTVEVPFAELKPSLDTAYKRIAEQVTVPGFRKGKVPPRIIDQRLGRGAVLEEAINSALPDLYGQAVQENRLEVVGRPEVEVTEFVDGDQLKFTAEVDVRPEFELPDYKGVEVQVDDVEVSDADVDEQVQALRKRFGTLTGVERAVQDGDYVTIDLLATIDGEELEDGTASAVSYEVGSESMVDGLDEAIIGKSAGESAEFVSTLVGGAHAGEQADIKVTVGAVKARELPELDDEFAQMASEFDTLEELRSDVRSRLERARKFEQGAQARDKVLESVLTQVEVPLPAKTVEAEIAWRNEQLDEQIQRAGMTREGFFKLQDQEPEAFAADLDKQVRDGMKAQFVLDRLADKEELSVNQAELTQHLIERASGSGLSPDQFAKQVVDSGQVPALVGEVRRGKALRLILENAQVKDASGNTVDLSELDTPTLGEGPDAFGRELGDEHYGHDHA
ncbi:trigger factor [Actinocrinis puniceicyclus]|uniref:Trigger factor n=1 Tax=Actinocrinis puniceicyclus TaxID=977794 RepID=A0A8J8BB67_9ACTN|nr:trigger factor [Actinocrinis puniceicyclus]MBS2962798.1 trigger factor [Actinocrinis puniceicyclus]